MTLQRHDAISCANGSARTLSSIAACESGFNRHLAEAKLTKRVTSYSLRHSLATHLLESGTDIRTIQELLGYADVKATMIYTHVFNRGRLGVISPLDVNPPDPRETPEAHE